MEKNGNTHAEAVNSVLTKKEAAALLKVSARFLENMVNAGRLNVFKPTRKLWRVSRRNLDAFLESGGVYRQLNK